MKNKHARIKIIKDTVMNSILIEIESKLRDKKIDEKKINESKALIKSKIKKILESYDTKELIPNREFNSQIDFENHLSIISQKTKQKLLAEMEKME